MTTTTENQTVIEFELNRNDAEELLYSTLGWGERAAFEIEMVGQGDAFVVLMGEQSEMREWAEERWAPLSKAKGWPAGRPLIVRGVVVDWNE